MLPGGTRDSENIVERHDTSATMIWPAAWTKVLRGIRAAIPHWSCRPQLHVVRGWLAGASASLLLRRRPSSGLCAWLEPISKSFEEDDEAGKLDKAEEIVGVVLPANEDPALPLNPGEEALDEPRRM